MSGKAFPWETPLSSSDGLKDTTVQVVSDVSTIQNAVRIMKKKPKEKDFKRWLGQPVLVEEVDGRGEVLCKLLNTTAEKAEKIRLVPGALTSIIHREEELVHRTLRGIYASVCKKLETGTRLAVHVLCKAAESDSLFCVSVPGDEIHEFRRSSSGFYHADWRHRERGGKLTLKFTKNKSDGILQRSADFVRNFFSGNSDGYEEVNVTLPPAGSSAQHVFCELKFGTKTTSSKVDVDSFVAALQLDLATGPETEKAALLSNSIEVLGALLRHELRPGTDLDLKWLAAPMSPIQSIFALYVLGRFLGPPDASRVFRGCWVVVEQRGREHRNGKKKGSHSYVGEVLQVGGQKLSIQKADGTIEEVDSRNVEPLWHRASLREEVMQKAQEHILDALMELRGPEMELLFDAELFSAFYGLQSLLSSDAAKGGVRWVHLMRHFAEGESQLGSLNLHELLKPLAFKLPELGDRSLQQALSDFGAKVDEMRGETREAFFKALLGRRCCIDDVVTVLLAAQAPARTGFSLGELFGRAAEPEDPKALMHKILGSLAFEVYQKLMMDNEQRNKSASRLGSICGLFQKAGSVQVEVLAIWEAIFTALISQARWLPDKLEEQCKVEELGKSFAALLGESEGDVLSMLKEMLKLLVRTCVSKGNREVYLPLLMKHLSTYMDHLDQEEVKGWMSAYILHRCSERSNSLSSVGKDARHVMCALRAGGELLSMAWLEPPMKLIHSVVQEICQETPLLVLLELLQHLGSGAPMTDIPKEMCHLLVEMLANQAPGLGDGGTLTKSVKFILIAVAVVPDRYKQTVDDALVTLLSVATPVEVPILLESSGQPWRVLLQAWDQLDHGAKQKLTPLFQGAQKYLETLLAGDITLDAAETLLERPQLADLLGAMAKYLVNDEKTFGHSKLSEIGASKWCEEVVKHLKKTVGMYNSAAESARAFLTLCQHCGLQDGLKVSRAGLAMLNFDRQRILKELPSQEGRWWFCTHKAVKRLQHSAIFRSVVSEWAKSQLSDAFGQEEEDADVEDEDEEVVIHESAETYEEFLNSCRFMSASRRLCSELENLFQRFAGLCKLLACTAVDELDWRTVRSIVAMDKDVKEQLQAAGEAADVQFPEATKKTIETAARIDTAAKDLQALLDAANVCEFPHSRELEEQVGKIVTLEKQASRVQPVAKKDVISQWLVQNEKLRVKQVAQAVDRAEILLLSKLQGKCLAVTRALAEAKEIFDFVKSLPADDDLMHLQGSVETHSDELLRADTIFALIEVQRFFKALKRQKLRHPGRSFEDALKQCVSDLQDIKDLADKLGTCTQHSHGLQNLYKNLSKREEVAAAKIQAAMKEGTYEVVCKRDGVAIMLRYRAADNSRKTLSKQDLSDLRARAVLNPADSTKTSSEERKIFMRFSEQVEVLFQACTSLETLREEGWYWAREKSYEVTNPDALLKLRELKQQFQESLENWRAKLQEARARFPELSFVYSKQFWLLGDFLQGISMPNCDAQMVLSMLSHIQGKALSQSQRSRALDLVRSYSVVCLPVPEKLQDWFQMIGERLVSVLEVVTGRQQEVLGDGGNSTLVFEMETGLNSVLELGKVRTVHARSKGDVLRTALSFYGGAGRLPCAHEMLFCSPSTSWPQLDAFLSRCRHVKGLYCILHVERLTYKLQHDMVESINSGRLGSSYRLVLVAMCPSDHVADVHTLTELPAQPAHTLSQEGLQHFVRHLAPNLVCVLSDDAGCGKTEMVRQRAFALRKAAITVPLSGPLDMANFIERLLMQKWRPCDCLHLDIGPTQELDLLDDILVQISFFGCVQAESKIAVVPRDYTFVELANVSTSALRDLTISSLVTPSVARFDMNHFYVCPEPRSPVQVVCKVLEAHDNYSLESRRVALDGDVIAEECCRELLSRHIVQKLQGPPSYSLLNTVLRVLADQLISFCNSAYFDPKQLKDLKLPTSLRTQLLQRLLEACLDFTTRAVTAGRLRQRNQHGPVAEASAAICEGMMRWSDTKPLLLFNRFDLQTLSLIFREERQVAEEMRKLFLSQDLGGTGRLPNFQSMSTTELETRLGRIILRLGKELGKPAEGSSYVVSPDNFIKMIWIALRVESRIPVIIMGETGCGKTSLIRHLAKLLSVEFRCLNVHAGTSAKDIIAFVKGAGSSAGTTWAFLDEVNTCEHMGLVTEILCHRRVLGEPLPENVVLLAACNPYRLKKQLTEEAARAQAQLSLRVTSERRKFSKLVYSVHELLESLYDYLYDFGSLGEREEESYVKAMVEPIFGPSQFRHGRSSWPECLTDLIMFSQRFTAENQPDCLLSLRDVKRCVELIKWFQETFVLREKARPKACRPEDRDFLQDGKALHLSDDEKTLRSVLNALAVSYHCRLPTNRLRNTYRAQIAQRLAVHGRPIEAQSARQAREGWEPGNIINWLLRNEMWLYLRHMKLPEMTATNNALLENVFVMMVCILNRIPIFAVGKPGNSKSLALRILNANLRGKDSEEELWREFPRIYVISYQGSEVSTSEGIEKVFEKALTYKNSIANDALVLVHFDEIGLAEASPNNPLKVLHAHLEPGYPKDRPDFAVVGLSNFPLDAAKMNRGIALVRPPPQNKDLVQTAKKICEGTYVYREAQLLNSLADLYCAYYQDQPVADFHGLRDFYALIKTLAKNWPRSDWERRKVIYRAIERNFGGLPPTNTSHSEYGDMHSPCPMWQKQHRYLNIHVDSSMRTSVVEMLEENLADKDARHLLLVCSGEVNVALNLVQTAAEKQERSLQIMMGSTFTEDQSDHYSFGLLKRVVLSMERGDILVMRALDSIHGSLYDMLNMSYTSFGSKRHCRIALGDTDIFAQVHDNFRCVVLQDAAKLSTADAAFLNRFEKHHVSINDLVTQPPHRYTVRELEKRVALATKGPRLSRSSKPQSLFVGWGAESAASLIHQLVQRCDKEVSGSPNRLVDLAWRDLVSVASVDGMLRATELSDWAHAADAKEIQEWRQQVFTQPQSLQDWLMTNGWQNAPSDSATAVRFAVVLTTSPTQVDLEQVLRDRVPAFKSLAVDALTSELDLSQKLDEFNDAPLPPGAVLVLQLRADSPHVELVRHRCNELRKERRALLLLHGSRVMMSGSEMGLRLSFQTGWSQVFLERLIEERSLNAQQCVELQLEDLVKADGPMPFQKVLKSVLSECFWYIKYPATQAAAEHVKKVTEVALNDKGLLELFQRICLEKIRNQAKQEVWWHQVIREMQRMPGHASFADCIQAHVRELVRGPAAVLIYLLEKNCALKTLSLYPSTGPMRNAWFDLCTQRIMPQLERVPRPTGPEQYQYEQHLQHLRVPFSSCFAAELDSFRSSYFERKLHQVHSSDPRLQDLTEGMKAAVGPWFHFLQEHQDDYAEDLAALRVTAVPLPQEEQRRFLRPIMQDRVQHGGIPELHQFLWRHQGTLQLALRQLAAVPSSVRDLDGLLSSQPVPTAENQLRPNVARMMSIISAHACGALHPTATTLAAVRVDWLPTAVRVLSAAKSCLEELRGEEALPLVEFSALSIMTELSQKMERINLEDFWKQIGLREVVRRPKELSELVQEILKAAEPHLAQTQLQRFQRFAHQRLLEHGVSEGVLRSVVSGRPAVATAMLLRELVQSAVLADSSCFLTHLETGRDEGNKSLRVLDKLVQEVNVDDPLCAVMCIELQDWGFPDVDVASVDNFLPSDVVSAAVTTLKSLFRQPLRLGLAHVTAAAVLRLTAQCMAEALMRADSLDGLEEALCEACEHAGSDAAGFIASLLRGTVLREVHSRLQQEDASGGVVELCKDVPWLAMSLPVPGDAPLLKGTSVPFFLGGFMPEAVAAAQVISTAAGLKTESPDFLDLMDKATSDGPLRFACFCASSPFLVTSSNETPQEKLRNAARSWFQEHPKVRTLPLILRAQTEALPAALTEQLQASPMQMLTALHLTLAVLAAPSSGFSAPFQSVALGRSMSGFLPAMPEDEEEEILRALDASYNNTHWRGHTRYLCQCGYKYIVADCGQAVQSGKCPSCHREIGGYNYAERNNRRLDQRPQLGQSQGQEGYFHHEASRDRRQVVRQLTPLPYRALHFLLHSALLGPHFREGMALGQASLASILQHLNADWMVLTELVDGSPVALLMQLAERLLYPTWDAAARDALSNAERGDWERRVAEAVVMPCVDPTRRADFEAKLDWAASLGSMKDALPPLLADRLRPMGTTPTARAESDSKPELPPTELPELFTINGRFLELGCGDLSFARSLLAGRLRRRRTDGFQLTTTMLEPWDVVKARYNYQQRQLDRPSAESHRSELERGGSTVLDGVDGTRLAETLPGSQELFDAVIFNFPYGGTFTDQNGPKNFAEHISLVDGVFRSAKPLLTRSDGCIWITLLSSQLQSWKVEDLARRRGLVLTKRVLFPWRHFPEYHTVWGDERDFQRTQPRQSYTGRDDAILCCFATPEARRRVPTPEPAETTAQPADLAVKVGCSRLLRRVDKPTMGRLECEFQGLQGQGPAAQHPLLRAVLEANDDLHLVTHLAAILDWQRFVRRHFEFDLSREEARKLKVRDAFPALKQKGSQEDVRHGRRLFERFQAAWAAGLANGCMVRYGCKELHDVPSMSLESPLSLSCADESENVYIVALMLSLVEKQNNFLNQVLDMAKGELPAASAIRSVLEYWFHPGRVSLPLVNIEDVNEMHLLIPSAEENGLAWMSRLGASGAYGAWEVEMPELRREPELLVPGTQCVFDWDLLEYEAAERLLQKAVLIDFKVVPFPFRGEAFLNDFDFLEEVSRRVAQEKSSEEARNFLLSSVKAADLMASLQAALAVVRRLKPSPDMCMADLCHRWLDASQLHDLMQQPECARLKVGHLVHLFEMVELQAAKDIFQGEAIPSAYRQALAHPLPAMQAWKGSTALRAQEIMLRILIRWLSHGQPKANELVATYAEKALRQVPPEAADGMDELFGDLKLAHLGNALCWLLRNGPSEPSSSQGTGMVGNSR